MTENFDNTDINDGLEVSSLSPVLDAYAEWFGRIVRRLFYPEKFDDLQSLPMPDKFEAWARYAHANKIVEKDRIAHLHGIYTDLHNSASSVAQKVFVGKGRPELKEFEVFVNFYDEFIVQMRRVEVDNIYADHGLDIFTGLRSSKAMSEDLAIELERRTRRGRPFCLVIARIDDYSPVVSEINAEQNKLMVQSFSAIIKKCMRSFDDAYRSNDDEFVMCLKQTDTTGGAAAIARLKSLLDESPVIVPLAEGPHAMSMSYCAAEPVPGDDIDELLDNMRADLVDKKYGSKATLEYVEQSPLQRFISEDEDAEVK